MSLSARLGVNGAPVHKPVGEPRQERIDVQAEMIKLKHAISFHRVQDLVNKHNIFCLNGHFYRTARINHYFSIGRLNSEEPIFFLMTFFWYSNRVSNSVSDGESHDIKFLA